jgi:hypothetical protein
MARWLATAAVILAAEAAAEDNETGKPSVWVSGRAAPAWGSDGVDLSTLLARAQTRGPDHIPGAMPAVKPTSHGQSAVALDARGRALQVPLGVEINGLFVSLRVRTGRGGGGGEGLLHNHEWH